MRSPGVGRDYAGAAVVPRYLHVIRAVVCAGYTAPGAGKYRGRYALAVHRCRAVRYHAVVFVYSGRLFVYVFGNSGLC